MILNDEQLAGVGIGLELGSRMNSGIPETWEEEQIRNCLDTIADLKRQLAERDTYVKAAYDSGFIAGADKVELAVVRRVAEARLDEAEKALYRREPCPCIEHIGCGCQEQRVAELRAAAEAGKQSLPG